MLNTPHVQRLIKLALEEDLGRGDLTASLSVSPEHKSTAEIIAREDLIICGLPVVNIIIECADSKLKFTELVSDGETLKPDTVIGKLEGATVDILSLERTFLNFLQRLSGVATFTKDFVSGLDKLTVLDTRKTTPGWRLLEKYAVRVGGAKNHRMDLSDMLLVKNNHISACGSDLDGLLSRINSSKPPYVQLEVEVRDEIELKAALKHSPSVVMLDNMNDGQVSSALEIIGESEKPPLVEVSGGITVERAKKLDKLGVDFVSVGALTTKSRWRDISLRIN